MTFGVLLAIETGWSILDPALAGLVALNILWSGWKVMKSSLSGLMDESVSSHDLKKIREVIAVEAVGALKVHDLRTRHAGKVIFIDFHLVVPGQTTVTEAHEICDRIQHMLKTKVPDAMVTNHVEPENKAKHTGVVVL